MLCGEDTAMYTDCFREHERGWGWAPASFSSGFLHLVSRPARPKNCEIGYETASVCACVHI